MAVSSPSRITAKNAMPISARDEPATSAAAAFSSRTPLSPREWRRIQTIM